jgi:hypothetical protein
MNSQRTMTPWQKTAAAAGTVVGQPIRFNAKEGCWTRGPAEYQCEGVEHCLAMPTGRHGEVKFASGKPVDPRSYSYNEVESAKQVTQGYVPTTSVVCVRVDGDLLGNGGELSTIQFTTWSGRQAFEALASDYAMRGERQFPVVTLGSRLKRGDRFDNHEPTLTVVDWIPRANFAELIGEDPEAPRLSTPQPVETERSTAGIAQLEHRRDQPAGTFNRSPQEVAGRGLPIDDDIPF